MKLTTRFFCATLLAAAVLLLPRASAQEHSDRHHRYKLIDLGTLGGPHSYGSVNGDGFQLLNNSGVVASYADTALHDPNAPNSFLTHAFRWKDGVMTDLGALPGVNNSAAGSINARGWAAGQSGNGLIDPLLGIPESRAVLWKHGQIMDLGTLGGNESLGIYVNDAGQVIGISSNAVPDPFSLFGFGVQMRTFLWQDGVMQDIGTLGGPDALPGASCSGQPAGLIVGGSYTNFSPNALTGAPTLDPFLWKNGQMIDLGTLGGAIGFAQCANNRGQVIGQSSIAAMPGACVPGNIQPGCHPFLWEEGELSDLGTLGGDTAEAIWINDAGDVAGSADFPGNKIHDAVLWRHGKIHDLGTVTGDPCSRGRGLNARGQVVGGSSDCRNFLHAFLWEEGGPMFDLNTLIPPGSGMQLTNAFNINDRGEILAKAAPLGFTPNDDADLGHLVLLVPCEADDDEEGCSGNAEAATVGAPQNLAITNRTTTTLPQRHLSPGETATGWRTRLARQYHILGTPKN